MKELAERFSEFFESKISKLRNRGNDDVVIGSSTSAEGTRPPATSHTQSCSLERFSPVSQTDVSKIIKSNKIKPCSIDPVPASVFLKCKDVLLPALTDMVNQSLETSTFPSSLKSALIIPTLKRISADPETLKNYRPISNLPFLGKVMERVVTQKLMTYFNLNSLLPSRQSA